MTDFLSSAEEKGKYVTQLITFVGGVKKTFQGVITSSIHQGQLTKFNLRDGRLVLINDSNVLSVEIFTEL